MELPAELWESPDDRRLVQAATDAFATIPLIVTDKLTNAVFLNRRAEELFGENAEALVNRTSYSLLGFGNRGNAPKVLPAALLGESRPWRGVVEIHTPKGREQHAAEASAVLRDGHFVCGLIRLAVKEATQHDA